MTAARFKRARRLARRPRARHRTLVTARDQPRKLMRTRARASPREPSMPKRAPTWWARRASGVVTRQRHRRQPRQPPSPEQIVRCAHPCRTCAVVDASAALWLWLCVAWVERLQHSSMSPFLSALLGCSMVAALQFGTRLLAWRRWVPLGICSRRARARSGVLGRETASAPPGQQALRQARSEAGETARVGLGRVRRGRPDESRGRCRHVSEWRGPRCGRI